MIIMSELFVANLLIGFLVSFFAGLLVERYLHNRKKRIVDKINDVDREREYLEKLGKGYQELLRSSFHVLFTLLAIVLGSAAISRYLSKSPTELVRLIGEALFIGGVAIACVFSGGQAVKISRILNFDKTVEKLEKKKTKLKDKL